MYLHVDDLDKMRESLQIAIDKRCTLEAQGKAGRDLHERTVAQIASVRSFVEQGILDRVANPLTNLADRTARWVVRTFGLPNLTDRRERARRIVEEAIEVAQSEGIDEARVRRLVERVYSRPVGMIGDEIGGLLLTIAAWQANTPSMSPFVEAERLLSTKLEPGDPERFRAKHADKVAAGVGLPMPGGPRPRGPMKPCPAEATGNPIDCGGCPEHTAPSVSDPSAKLGE